MPPRMRTVPQIVAELKLQDENTAISEHYLRKLVKTGKIPCVNAGRKVLICLDTIYDYLQNPTMQDKEIPQGIRRVSK